MKQAIVTGGSSGLGFEIAASLIKRDVAVTIIGRDIEKLEKAKSALEGHVEIYSLNVGDEQAVESFYKAHQHADYLFNVAGVGIFGHLESINRTMIQQSLEANLIGMILMTKNFLLGKEKAKVVNVISTAGKVGKDNEAVYCATKFGARGFTESLQKTYKGTAIKILGIYPGGMNTPFWHEEKASFMDPKAVAEQIVQVSLDDGIYVTELVIERP